MENEDSTEARGEKEPWAAIEKITSKFSLLIREHHRKKAQYIRWRQQRLEREERERDEALEETIRHHKEDDLDEVDAILERKGREE